MAVSPLPSTPKATRANTSALFEVRPDIWGFRNVFANLYFLRTSASSRQWVLLDAGLPGSGKEVQKAAELLFGADNPPQAIILTHGHFDHVGALAHLLALWPQVLVYAHVLELPYLTGVSAYPPPDPTVGGGAMAALSFLYPKQPINLGARVQALPADGSVPALPAWRWVATPGHTPGHVSLFREQDRTLLAGDAFVTVLAESGLATLTQRQEVHGPPAYFTPDWQAARRSVVRLAALQPELAATGHGIPMQGPVLQQQLNRLVLDFTALAVPAQGRYVPEPAVADATGVVYVPPARRLVPGWAIGAGLVLVAALLWQRATRTTGPLTT
ncbi:MBL fold metallo-hydrolase [Hymenobacter sp. UYP22]|uniref:MBL fold metallo-hydrolase n=1 Tax=Hymenobacter sp. UYP22 TaxID=3156348 RepID=UPI0033938880